MKTRTGTTIIASALLILAMGSPATATASGEATFQSANFHDFPAGTTVQPSAGTLIRRKQSVHANLALSGLDLSAAYSVWWVIWNDPSQCMTEPCTAADLGAPGNVAIYATGFVTGESGAMSITANLSAGRLPSGIFEHPGIPGILGHGRGFRAEIHLLVESHGSILPGAANVQISEDNGACSPACIIQQGIAFLPTK